MPASAATTERHEQLGGDDAATLLRIRDLVVVAQADGRDVSLLNRMELIVPERGRVGIVGESGSGKSMTASAVLRLLPEGVRMTGGSIMLRERELMSLTEPEMQRVRGKEISIVYQNALATLNPLERVGNQIAAVARAHLHISRSEARDRAVEMLDSLGIPAAPRRARDYPHQFSGGMAQRVSIAMALICGPALLIADEPTTGLDATIQAHVLEVIDRSVRERESALLLISHDLAVVEAMCDVVAVVYAGHLLEFGRARDVLGASLSPYTKALVACLSSTGEEIAFIPGRIPEPGSFGDQCPFADRCSLVSDRCRRERPLPRQLRPDQWVACHNV
jgi:peptide/nickel transport system ATP-binding protein